MTEDKILKLEKKIAVVNRIRVVSLCLTAAILAVVWFLKKYYEQSSWYEGFFDKIMAAAMVIVVVAVAATFVKLMLYNRYRYLKHKTR